MSHQKIDKIVALVENKLAEEQLPEIEEMILEDPDTLDTIHEMASLKRMIGEEKDLQAYLAEQKRQLFERMAQAKPC